MWKQLEAKSIPTDFSAFLVTWLPNTHLRSESGVDNLLDIRKQVKKTPPHGDDGQRHCRVENRFMREMVRDLRYLRTFNFYNFPSTTYFGSAKIKKKNKDKKEKISTFPANIPARIIVKRKKKTKREKLDLSNQYYKFQPEYYKEKKNSDSSDISIVPKQTSFWDIGQNHLFSTGWGI